MTLVDVNILVTVHREDAVHHLEVRSWLERRLASPDGIAISELILSGVLRVITHPRAFDLPTPLARALAYVEGIRERPEVRIACPGLGHWGIFTDLCRRGDARDNNVADA